MLPGDAFCATVPGASASGAATPPAATMVDTATISRRARLLFRIVPTPSKPSSSRNVPYAGPS